MSGKAMEGRELTVREKRILYFTIHKFIHDREPIGSRTIAKAFGYEMSPATVRNICQDLEEWGFLNQPHTSAGRKPTDMGYRFYLNELIRIQELARKQRERIVRELTEKVETLDDILQKTGHLLTQVSSHTSVVIYPDSRHIEIGRLSLMLDKPDFKDIGKLREAMRVIEEPEHIGEIFRSTDDRAGGVDVILGRELNEPALNEFGIIKANYQVNDHVSGSFGIVGPKRMPYGRMIAIVRTIKEAVNGAFRRIGGKR